VTLKIIVFLNVLCVNFTLEVTNCDLKFTIKKMNTIVTLKEESIASHIHYIRGEKVILDADLASLYGVETRVLKQAVRRNKKRFPPDFMFELTTKEYSSLRTQIASLSWGGSRYKPFAFTEQGVAMLSGVLNSPRAIEVNIAIMRTFVQVRTWMKEHKELAKKVAQLEKDFEGDFAQIYQTLNQLINPPIPKKKKIGFQLPSKK
jgi:hypothetical protein